MARVLVWVTLAGCALAGEDAPAPRDDCEAAQRHVQACGASLALLDVDRCAGPSLLVADCVLAHDGSCDALAALRFDDCLADVGIEPEDLPALGLDPTRLPDEVDPTEPPTPSPERSDDACDDGVDNDRDGYPDCLDFDCAQSTDVTVCRRTP